MKLLMLTNPRAGRSRGLDVAQKSLERFQQQGITVENVFSEYPGHLVEVAAREVNGPWDGIVALGGDGTLFEVINGMMQGNPELPLPLGVLPAGTGNSFSRDLAIRTHADAMQKILAGQTRPVDLGLCTCGDRRFVFINILGFGFVADVAQKAWSYRRWGALNYVIGVFIITKNLRSYPLEMEIDGRLYQRDNIFVEISNSRKTGGDMIMAPDALIDDGLLDVVLLNKVSRLRLLSALPKIFKGTHLQMKEVEHFTAKSMSFKTIPAKALTPDGEIAGSTPMTIAVLPGKIRVFG
ncbi:MAG TPA: diacylglycerol kinase family lipid kinase [bacterium]|nr:diacylglycerol kinase family lipid kinase [bacterium]HQG44460.1 diacylglycerol kinase family lipid kinase [bacterium]HQI49391.1 diacylglycerol kinase family lipid kinase [bacterium]HQJ65338.1 diacylglycerol kinase family lipid kinase [bacterium]